MCDGGRLRLDRGWSGGRRGEPPAGDEAGARGGTRRPEYRGPVHEGRTPHPDARRRLSLHVDLRAARHLEDVPDHAVAHPLRRRAVRRVRLPDESRSKRFEDEGFIFVYQDVRGKFMSEGEFVQVRPVMRDKAATDIDETTDTYDTVKWLIDNIAGHNGRVGMWGISYPGFYASMGAIDAHPAVKAVSPQAPVGDWFIGDDFRHNGALFLAHAFRWISYHGRARPEPGPQLPSRVTIPTPDGYALPALPIARRPGPRRAQGRGGVLDPDDRARYLRRVLARTRRPAAPAQYRGGLPRRGRLVRRGGSLRGARDLSRDRAVEPPRRQPPGDGAAGITASGRPRMARRSATCSSARTPRSSINGRSSSRSSCST